MSYYKSPIKFNSFFVLDIFLVGAYEESRQPKNQIGTHGGGHANF